MRTKKLDSIHTMSSSLPRLFLLSSLLPFASGEWTPLEQVKLLNPTDVVTSPDGNFAAYTIGAVSGTAGKLGASSSLVVVDTSSSSSSSVTLSFCSQAQGGCSSPQFSSDGSSLAFVSGGDVYQVSVPVKSPTVQPTKVNTGVAAKNGGVLAFALSPHKANRIAFTYAEMGTFSTTEPRVITDDVIVNVIAGAAQPIRNVLCVGSFVASDDDVNSDPICYTGAAYKSVGMEGWRISCWPFDSQFSWNAAGDTLALTLTDDRTANGWESVIVATVDVTSPSSKFVPIAEPTLTFQPLYSPDGSFLAYTQADTVAEFEAGKPDAYTWAQTWRVCVAPVVADDSTGTI